MKKLLSLFMTILMVLFCLPAAAFAADGDKTDVERYTVLVLDTSDSLTFQDTSGNILYVADTAIEYVRKASIRFINNISNASGNNYVAVVSYKEAADVVSGFSKDYDSLKDGISSLKASDNVRSIAAGLSKANELLSAVQDQDAVKNVVLFTTGMANAGDYIYDGGHYDDNVVGSRWRRMDTGVRLYAYANAAVSQAETIKNSGASLYTIGLFQTMENMPEEGKDVAELFRLTAADLASSEGYYYPVENPDDLEFTFGEVADDIVNKVKEITFTYQSGEDYTAKCYYTDDYFSESAYLYNESLATMSLSFAMSAFGSSSGGQTDYTDKSVNARNLLKEIGVAEESIATNDWFTKKPTTDSIGVIAGNKQICVDGETYTLIAVAVRGGGYEQEWAGNFTIGKSGQHKGFKTAKENVLEFISQYIADQGIAGPVKFWVTGYSRAAATANLVSAAIDDGTVFPAYISFSSKDVYSYCFETPAGELTSSVKDESKYNNIFNIINSSDPVPYVAPAAMGFGRYGIDRYLPSAESSPDSYSELKSAMLKIYNSLDSTSSYVVDDFQMKKLAAKNWLPGGEKISFVQDDKENNYSQGLFLSNYVTILSKEFLKTRSNYVSGYQDEIREICSVVFGCTDKQSEILINSIVSQAKEEWGSLAGSYIWNVGINPWGDEDDALQIVSDWLANAVKEAGITDYDQKTLDAAGKDLGDLMLALISNHPNYFTTAVMNGSGLAAAHYPELCYSWLASMDSNYNGTGSASFNNGGYRIVRINCKVNVEVYDTEGRLVAAIINEASRNPEGSDYISGIDQDGQKYIVLPNTGEYRIVITGREDDTVNYSISEYSAMAGDFTRVVNYFDLPVKKGEQLTGNIPSYTESEIEDDTPDGSSVKYTLYNAGNEPVESDSDLSGDEAEEAYYHVSVKPSNEKYGITTGTGVCQLGQFAQAEAIALEGYRFTGWYIDGRCVSGDEIYRFCVTGDVELTGQFEPEETHTHSYGKPVFGWSSDYSSCTAEFTCEAGDDTQKSDCTVTSKTVQPTEEKDGQVSYTATVEFKGQTYTDTQSVVIPRRSSADESETSEKPAATKAESTGTENGRTENVRTENTGTGSEAGNAQTGDTSHPLFWLALSCAAFAAILLLTVSRKKASGKKDEDDI